MKENNQLSFQLVIESKDDLLSVLSDIDVSDTKILKELEENFADAINERIQNTFRKTQELGVDAFNLGEYFEWHYPKDWNRMKENWPDYYKNLELESEVTLKIKRPGATKNSPWVKHKSP